MFVSNLPVQAVKINYPEINETTFKGYPFVDGDNRKFIFSGGSLYKTFSENDYYYKIIDYIMNKYPNRVYYTHERPDFYEIIKRSYFYLSTYPVCGGDVSVCCTCW